jgi:hypothetical protein
LETTFDFGGERLALSDELDGVLAAAYHIHGLAFYCCKTVVCCGAARTSRRCNGSALSRDGATAYCGRGGFSA